MISYCKRQGGLAKALIPPAPCLLCAPGQKFKQYVLIATSNRPNISPRLIVVLREPALISMRSCCSRNLTTLFWPFFATLCSQGESSLAVRVHNVEVYA